MIAQALIQHIFTRKNQIGDVGYDRHVSVGLMTTPLNMALDKALEESKQELFPQQWGFPQVQYHSYVDLGIGRNHMTVNVDVFMTNKDDFDGSATFKLDVNGNLLKIFGDRHG